MYKVKIFITRRDSIIDPAGAATKDALHQLGFQDVGHVRVDRMIGMTLDSGEEIEARVDQMCKELLVNPVMEDYRYEIEKEPS